MAIEQGITRTWTRSSYSAGNGACVEVKSPARGLLAIRDSKVPGGPRLGFAPRSWSAFLGVMDGAARVGERA
ncbi:DUF397 domain-containing protein [Streptomyces sp. NPDC049881]|uniref:DUF397 domain-containing protein n=1 Tax=unclassified Streptomyces TaxID=2593676 RepID=UPI003424A3FB